MNKENQEEDRELEEPQEPVDPPVVQDNTPNNLRSGVTNILNNLQTIEF